MHVRIATAISIILLAAFCGPGSADGASAPRGPSQAVSSPVRASTAVVRWATSWQAQAAKNRRALNRTRACFGLSAKARPPASPGRTASGEEWKSWGRQCKHLAVRYHQSFVALHYRLLHPPGTGAARWWPLARFLGWPSSQRANWVYCVAHESGGHPRASNGICDGLMQINRCHHLANATDPLVNVAYGLRLWRAEGWGPWVTMSAR